MRPRQPAERTPAGGSEGFILIAVLWILATLAALASTYSVYVVNTAFATRVNDDRLQIKNAISSGVELAAYRLLADNKPAGAFSARLSRSTISVQFASEAARVDLNAAPKALLAGLFSAVGVSSSDGAKYAERIAGWRRTARSDDDNREAQDYKEAGYDYVPRRGPFQNTLELPLVLGLPRYVAERVLPLVTVYSGAGQIDIRVAPPEVVSALPEITREQLRKVLAQRAQNPDNGQALLNLLGPASALASVTANPAARVEVSIRLDNGRTARAEVVILILKEDEEPFRILSWRDDSDGPID